MFKNFLENICTTCMYSCKSVFQLLSTMYLFCFVTFQMIYSTLYESTLFRLMSKHLHNLSFILNPCKQVQNSLTNIEYYWHDGKRLKMIEAHPMQSENLPSFTEIFAKCARNLLNAITKTLEHTHTFSSAPVEYERTHWKRGQDAIHTLIFASSI